MIDIIAGRLAHASGLRALNLRNSLIYKASPRRPRLFALVCLTLALVFLPSNTFAQVDTGTLSGIVRDQSGGIVQNAAVKVANPATGVSQNVDTNAQGLYSVPDLKAGVYQVSVSAQGFETITKTGIELRVQDRVALDFDLKVGQSSISVSVESQVSALQTETSSLGQVVADAQIQNMPLNGRNYIQLATLGAGTSPAYNASERNSFTANGVREIQNSYLLDGIDNKNKIVGFDSSAAQSIEPVIDSVQEFKVQTSTFSAEFGQAAGAVVNVTTKSGTNQLHASAFEYLRNSFFDADPLFPARRHRQTAVYSKPIRHHCRRPHSERPHLLFLRLAGHSHRRCRAAARSGSHSGAD